MWGSVFLIPHIGLAAALPMKVFASLKISAEKQYETFAF
jgi:hypothetical protein